MLAASINLDVIAVVARRTDRTICVKSEGFPADVISLDELEPVTDQKPTAAELIRGAAAWFQQYGCPLDTGFDAYTTSQVMPGSGLSSSAAFEVLLGNICNALYADNRFTPVELAQMGQYAENVYFHKPCGLMDQMASSVGGAVAIDFANPVKPVVHPVKFDFSSTGYALCIVDTGGNHADLTEEYAAIPREMGAVAKYFGKDVLSEVKSEQVLRSIPELRKACGDRAVLRAMHFYREDGRAQGESDALERGGLRGVPAPGAELGEILLLPAAKCLPVLCACGTAGLHRHCSWLGSAGRTWRHPGTRRRFRRNSAGICTVCAAVPVPGRHGGCAGRGLLPRAADSPHRRHDNFDLTKIEFDRIRKEA